MLHVLHVYADVFMRERVWRLMTCADGAHAIAQENLVPFAEYVRKGREQRHRSVPLTTKIARTICCCRAAPEVDDDDIDAALAQERAQDKPSCWRCLARGEEDKGQATNQAAKSKDWGAGVDDRLARPTGVLGKVCFPCFVVAAVCAPHYRQLPTILLQRHLARHPPRLQPSRRI